MKTAIQDTTGLEIAAVATCDFAAMEAFDNARLLRDFVGREPNEKLIKIIREGMGAEQRYHCGADQNAIDLARQAIANLLAAHPELREAVDFVIFAGISSPRPVTTVSALLANEFGLGKASCWDIKSGCSTGCLALMQAHAFLGHGARGGLVVCAETLSKFTDPGVLQMAASIGDGAAAAYVRRSERWRLRALVHGTDPTYSQAMAVKGTFPIDPDTYDAADYRFTFEDKPAGIKALGHHWVQSLADVLEAAGAPADSVTDYVAHQVDANKNAAVARACGIPDGAVARSFASHGNMGCPTVFVNYAKWLAARPGPIGPGDRVVFHAVGGGLSWAALLIDVQ